MCPAHLATQGLSSIGPDVLSLECLKCLMPIPTTTFVCSHALSQEYVLVLMHSRFGNKWSEIARFLPRRSENSIKNNW